MVKGQGHGMSKIVLAIIGAALVAGVLVTFPGLSPPAEAPRTARKGDHLDLTVRMANCPSHAWPYNACLPNASQPMRLVTTDASEGPGTHWQVAQPA
jgi:hypothetical protein